MCILTIDVGTTNTRVTLWNKEKPEFTISYEVGVRNSAIDNNNNELKITIKNAINKILTQKDLTHDDINLVLASGMITANVGLIEIPHLVAPVGIEDLKKGIIKKYFPDIIKNEIWFIPGVKNISYPLIQDNLESMDMMRGEEVEAIGLINRLKVKGPVVIILPGSHTKFIYINEFNQIKGCITTLAGEMFSLIISNSIVANSLNGEYPQNFDEDSILQGYEFGKKYGINRASFFVRILDHFTTLDNNQKSNFLLGAILTGDIEVLKKSSIIKINKESKIIIAGKDILADAFETIILKEGYFKNTFKATQEESSNLAGFGAICIANGRGD